MRRLTLHERQEAAEFLAQQPAEVLCQAVMSAAARIGTDTLANVTVLELCALNCDAVVDRSAADMRENPGNVAALENYSAYLDWGKRIREDIARLSQGPMPSMAGAVMMQAKDPACA